MKFPETLFSMSKLILPLLSSILKEKEICFGVFEKKKYIFLSAFDYTTHKAELAICEVIEHSQTFHMVLM